MTVATDARARLARRNGERVRPEYDAVVIGSGFGGGVSACRWLRPAGGSASSSAAGASGAVTSPTVPRRHRGCCGTTRPTRTDCTTCVSSATCRCSARAAWAAALSSMPTSSCRRNLTSSTSTGRRASISNRSSPTPAGGGGPRATAHARHPEDTRVCRGGRRRGARGGADAGGGPLRRRSAQPIGSTRLLLKNRRRLPRLSRALGTRFSANGNALGAIFDPRAPEAQSAQIDYGPTITSKLDLWGERRFLIEDLGLPRSYMGLLAGLRGANRWSGGGASCFVPSRPRLAMA